jgi:hypothetical protein
LFVVSQNALGRSFFFFDKKNSKLLFVKHDREKEKKNKLPEIDLLDMKTSNF